jgi:hypothetical protein
MKAVQDVQRARGIVARLAALPLLQNPRVRKALLWMAIIVAAVLVLWLLAFAWSLMAPSIKQLLVLLIVVSVVLLWFVKGAPWLERRQALRRAKGDLAPGDPRDEEEPRRHMLAALLQTKQVLARSPEVDRKRDPLYAIPWVLFLGDARAAAENLLQVARTTSPFPPPQPADTPSQYWRWWLFKGMIAIQADPRLVCDSSDRVTRGIWYHALQQLSAGRGSMPLNGIAVLVAADKLIGEPDAVRHYALNLRRLVDECMEHLQIVAPVYVIVTSCERLPGYEDFVRNLPVDALRQAVGHRLETAKQINASTWQEFNAIFAGLCDRMHAIRLAGIRREADPARRKGIWDFVQRFADLGPGLSVVIKTLLEDNPYQRTPQWRGLYFTAAAGKGGFVNDLVTRFLPADQPLARRTRQPGLKRWLGSAVSVVLVAGVTALVVHQASTAMSDNRRLREAVASACERFQMGSGLDALTDCAEDLTTIEALDWRAGLTWGISQYKQELADKKASLLSEIRKIINSYDARVEYDISSRFLSLDHIIATAQRLALIERCAKGPARCQRERDEPNLMFDPTSRLYFAVEPFTSKDKDNRQSDADGLLELYVAYLRWGSAADVYALTDESTRAGDYLRETVAIHPVTVEDIVAWSKTRYEPISAEGLWEMPQTISSHGRRVALPVIEAALTQRVWQSVLRPTFEQISLVADDPSVISALEQTYFERYFAAWRDFLAGFEQGVHGTTKTSADALLARAAQGDSPYTRLWRAVGENLFALPLAVDLSTRWALTWQEIKQNWTGVLGYTWRFLTESVGAEKKNAISSPTWLLALKYTLAGEWKGVEEDLAPYWPMLEADRSGEKAGEKALNLAREIFSSNGEKPDQFASLKKISDTPPARFKLKGGELPAWQSLAGEVQMLLTLIGYRAAARIDEEWRNRVLIEVKRDGTANAQRVSQTIQRFSQGTLAGFVNEADRTLKQVLGVTMPLSRRFQALLREQRDAAQPEGKPIRIGMIELIQPSTFGMVREGPAGTTVAIVCGTDDFTVSSRGQSRVDRQLSIMAVPEQCLTGLIKIALPEYELEAAPGSRGGERGAPRTLIKSYAEPIFGKLAEDFKTGAKTFTLADFQSSYSPEEWDTLSRELKMMGINQVRVFAAVTLSPEMEQRSGAGAATGSLPESIVE